ncbi:hypothetical protein HHI36_010655 [Cryptolaemus montrouzieri]|uniref:Uncharacterized protein n=1 Tax=Cryptolaemus montrouzieri TaxID=559131 RepID=A0ABD2MJM1_9CUCU
MDRDVDIEADRWIEVMLRVLNEHAPENIIEIKPNQNNKAWWYENISLNMKKRDCLLRRVTKKEENWKNFKKKRNKVVKIIRKQKVDYYKRKIDECKDDAVAMWKTLQRL